MSIADINYRNTVTVIFWHVGRNNILYLATLQIPETHMSYQTINADVKVTNMKGSKQIISVLPHQ